MILKQHLMICATALGVADGTATPAASQGRPRQAPQPKRQARNEEQAATASAQSQ